MIWHDEAPGQANGKFGHRDDWWPWCNICLAERMKPQGKTMVDEEFLESLDADILQDEESEAEWWLSHPWGDDGNDPSYDGWGT